MPQLQVLEPKERTSASSSIRVRRMSQPEPAEKRVTQRLQPERVGYYAPSLEGDRRLGVIFLVFLAIKLEGQYGQGSAEM